MRIDRIDETGSNAQSPTFHELSATSPAASTHPVPTLNGPLVCRECSEWLLTSIRMTAGLDEFRRLAE